jgi:hypothetical protein
MAADDDSAPPKEGGAPAEAPPVGRSWGRLYAVVLVALGVTVLLLTLLTWAYR